MTIQPLPLMTPPLDTHSLSLSLSLFSFVLFVPPVSHVHYCIQKKHERNPRMYQWRLLCLYIYHRQHHPRVNDSLPSETDKISEINLMQLHLFWRSILFNVILTQLGIREFHKVTIKKKNNASNKYGTIMATIFLN